ncbi:MAG: hypothetical protein JXA92_13475 [candidate division Zixibacteria bacterium]|nr:hypothetical protein [candidate division Zixibacteria bacterium]
MPDQELPSKIIEDTERRLEQIQNRLNLESEQTGLTRKIVSIVKPYWESADQLFKQGNKDPILTSGYQILVGLNEQVREIDKRTKQFEGQSLSLAGTASVFANSTGTTASVSGYSFGFNLAPIKQFRYDFTNHDYYSKRMSAIDPSLGKTFRAIKSAYLSNNSDGLRQALFSARQSYDHLFDILAKDTNVRKQGWWSADDPNKPEMVTRAQRLRYAAEKHVPDPVKQRVLESSDTHTTNVYNKINILHNRGSVDKDKGEYALFEMLVILKNWLDSINIV